MQADKLAGLLRDLDLGARGDRRRFRRSSGLAADRRATPRRGRQARHGVDLGRRLRSRCCSPLHYCGESIRVAWRGGMAAVVELPEWAEVLERNPAQP